MFNERGWRDVSKMKVKCTFWVFGAVKVLLCCSERGGETDAHLPPVSGDLSSRPAGLLASLCPPVSILRA